MKQNKKIAITGGIGSGKTAVCEILKKRGYPVFSCDDISRGLWKNAEYRNGLARLFPDCTENGEIVKERLSAHVFADKNALERLETYSHPRIMNELLRQMEGYAVAFAEVPLLFECAFEHLFDDVIAVRRNEDVRIGAVIQRDGVSEAQIRQRIARQFDPELLETKNCYILENNGSLFELEKGIDTYFKIRAIF